MAFSTMHTTYPQIAALRYSKAAIAILALVMLSGCASSRTTSENAIGGVMAGAMAGGAVGAVCCADPVHGIPAGILIGGVAGGVTGLLWPTQEPVAAH